MIKWFFFILAKIKLILIKVPCLLFFLLILAHNLPPSYFLIEEPYFHLNLRIPNYLIWKLNFALNSKKEYEALIENFLLFEFIPTTFFSLSLQIDLRCKTKINVFDTFPTFNHGIISSNKFFNISTYLKSMNHLSWLWDIVRKNKGSKLNHHTTYPSNTPQ